MLFESRCLIIGRVDYHFKDFADHYKVATGGDFHFETVIKSKFLSKKPLLSNQYHIEYCGPYCHYVFIIFDNFFFAVFPGKNKFIGH